MRLPCSTTSSLIRSDPLPPPPSPSTHALMGAPQHPTHHQQQAGGTPQLAGWAVRTPPLGGDSDGTPAVTAPASTEGTPKQKQKQKQVPAWGAAGLASDGLTAEERALREALEQSRQAEEEAAAAAQAEEERQLAAVLEASRVAEEARQREEKEARAAVEVRAAVRGCVGRGLSGGRTAGVSGGLWGGLGLDRLVCRARGC